MRRYRKTMKTIRRLLLLFLFAILPGACTHTPPSTPNHPSAPPSAEFSPLPSVPPPASIPLPTAEWLAQASVIKTKNLRIYYEGAAQGDYTAGNEEWHGNITGKVFVRKSDGSTLNLLNGVMEVSLGDAIHCTGPHQITFVDQAPGRAH